MNKVSISYPLRFVVDFKTAVVVLAVFFPVENELLELLSHPDLEYE